MPDEEVEFLSDGLPEGSGFAVLASGSGTNLQSLLDAYPGNVAVVAGDRKEAFAFERARRAGVPVVYLDPKDYGDRAEFDRELAELIAAYDVSLVVGAGYMRILSSAFLGRFPAVLNLHPSLLPAFRGLDAPGQALRAGVAETGVSVHFMVEEVDAGPVVAQEVVPVLAGDTRETLLARMRPVEHRLLVGAVAEYFGRPPGLGTLSHERPSKFQRFQKGKGFTMTENATAGKVETTSRRALISVSDKTGIVGFARILSEIGFEIVSTGGTAKAISGAGIPVTKVADVTGAPEILGGRVKTLHPKIHGGLLADRCNPDHVEQLEEQSITPIDLVCINLYPFEETVAGNPASEDEAVEQIDIGGPAMLRASAKNFHSVTVVPGPEYYEEILRDLEDGEVSLRTRRRLALATFRRTSEYDAAISAWMSGGEPGEPDAHLPDALTLNYKKALDLRYGENPHQKAAYYAERDTEHLLSGVEKLQGKDLSFNNLYDVDAARKLLSEFGDEPAAVIIKHANPCGAAVGETLSEAYEKALASDQNSAFGGIVVLNAELDGELAARVAKVFTEVLVAPSFTPEAGEVFAAKPNAVLLEAGSLPRPSLFYKPVTGGLLVQDADVIEASSEYEVVTKAHPSKERMDDLLFAWRVAGHVRSNAIVLVKDGATVGVGAGQMSRVDSSEIAIKKAGERVRGSVAASDAFFPFADGVQVLAEAGVAAVIEPGGSKRDQEVIDAADAAGVAMVFTGRRHFLH